MYNPALMNTKPYDLVIFDCDGVLVESEALACQIYVQMFAEYGYPLDYEETLHKFYGVTLINRLKVSGQELGWSPPDEFIPIFNQRLLDLSERELLVIPHVHELIESLNVPICVASNGTRDEIVFRLKVARLTERFGAAIFSGMEVPHPKPAPDVYLAAAQAFQTPPDRCVVIEDSILGVTAGVRAGMTVYGHATFNSAESLREAGAIPFANMLELKAMLNNAKVPVLTESLQ
jgi:HAD superfamily hydrolase (TIGR01509 family)